MTAAWQASRNGWLGVQLVHVTPYTPSPPPQPPRHAGQTYLEQNEGPGLQHLALKTNDIIATLKEMSARSELGGFEFMPRPCDAYYRALPSRIVGGRARGVGGCFASRGALHLARLPLRMKAESTEGTPMARIAAGRLSRRLAKPPKALATTPLTGPARRPPFPLRVTC